MNSLEFSYRPYPMFFAYGECYGMWDLCTKAVKTKWILSWDLIRPYIYIYILFIYIYIYSFWSLQGVALCFAVVYGYDMWNKGLIPKNNRSDSWLGIWDSNSMPHGHWNHQSDLLVGGFKTCLIFQNIWDNPSYWLFFLFFFQRGWNHQTD